MKAYLLDTNSIIYALNNRCKLPLNDYIISIITEIELLSYHKLTQEDEKVLSSVLSSFRNINLTNEIKAQTIRLRRENNLKLPDSIIVATAIVCNATLVTSDKQLLRLEQISTIEIKDLL